MMRQMALLTAVLAAGALPARAQGLADGGGLDLPGIGPGKLDGFGPSGRGSEAAKHFRASAVASHGKVRPGQTFHVAVVMAIGKGWVYYGPDPGSSPDYQPPPANIRAEGRGLTAGEVLWPADHPHETDLGITKVVNHVYEGSAVAFVPFTVPADGPPGRRDVLVTVGGQVCGNVCADLEVAAAASVTVADEEAANPAWTVEMAEALREAVPAAKLAGLRKVAGGSGPSAGPPAPVSGGAGELTVWTALPLAVLAGLILNVMPCVLPIVPLRILSLVQMAGQKRRRFVTLGLAFAGGILLFFVGIAAANAIIHAAARGTLDLSEHLQYRPVRIGMALVLVALAANLFGLFEVVVPSGGGTAGRQGRQGHAASVGMGFMMAVLATPCSFAVLAAVLLWAQVQPLWLGTVALLLIGIGMAAPHALLTAMPQLVDRLPKPGVWMELFKQAMGFLLLPVAVWLIFAGSKDTYPGWVVAFAIALAAFLWVWGKWVRYDAPLRRKLAIRGTAAVLLAGAGFWMLRPSKEPAVRFEPYSAERVEAARREGRIVLLKFTSATCASCIWLDYTVYDDAEVAAALAAGHVYAVVADVTDASAPAAVLLKERFGGAPPLTVLLRPGGGGYVRLDGKFAKSGLLGKLDEIARGG